MCLQKGFSNISFRAYLEEMHHMSIYLSLENRLPGVACGWRHLELACTFTSERTSTANLEPTVKFKEFGSAEPS